MNTNPDFIGGGTDFNNPFNKAAQIATKYIADATIVLIFMTDGYAEYPKKGIQALQNLQTRYPDKFKYSGI